MNQAARRLKQKIADLVKEEAKGPQANERRLALLRLEISELTRDSTK